MLHGGLVEIRSGAQAAAWRRSLYLPCHDADFTRPLAAIILAFVFRRPIASLLDRIESGKVPTPVGPFEFQAGGRRPNEQPPDVRKTATPEEGAAVEVSEAAADAAPDADAEELKRLVAELADANAELESSAELYKILNAIFEAQLNFLRWVKLAPEGVTWPAMQGYYTTLRTMPNSGWEDIDEYGFVNPLLSWQLLELTPSGNYKLSEKGHSLLTMADATVFYAQKAY